LFSPYPEPGIHGHDAELALPAEILFWAAQTIDGDAASQIASASTKSFLLLLTNGRTNCGDISFGKCPNSANLRAIK
jgi:hypothetical protein